MNLTSVFLFNGKRRMNRDICGASHWVKRNLFDENRNDEYNTKTYSKEQRGFIRNAI